MDIKRISIKPKKFIVRLFFILVCLCPLLFSGQREDWGTEFTITDDMPLDQRTPKLAMLKDSTIVLCYRSMAGEDWYAGLYVQKFSRNGEQIGRTLLVDSDCGYWIDYFDITSLINGGFQITYPIQRGRSSKIVLKRFASNGLYQNIMHTLVESDSAVYVRPKAAQISDDRFVYTWGLSAFLLSIFYGDSLVFAKKFKRQENQQVSYCPTLAMLGDKSFVLARKLEVKKNNEWFNGVALERYSNEGELKNHFSDFDDSFQRYWHHIGNNYIESLGNNTLLYVVEMGDGSGAGVWGKIYTNSFKVFRPIFRMNSEIQGDQGYSATAVLGSKGFVTVWYSLWKGGVWGQRFSIDGSRIGSEFKVYSIGGFIQPVIGDLDIIATGENEFFIAYTRKDRSRPELGSDIYGQIFPFETPIRELESFNVLLPLVDQTVMQDSILIKWQSAYHGKNIYKNEISYNIFLALDPEFETVTNHYQLFQDTSFIIPNLDPGKTYFLKILAGNAGGDSLWSSNTNAFFVSYTATNVSRSLYLPDDLSLLSNHPNPFNPTTTISFDLPKDGFVTLKIYNVAGRLVRVLVQEQKTAGAYTIVWNGLDDAGFQVAAGVYLYRLEFTAGGGERMVLTKKMSLVK